MAPTGQPPRDDSGQDSLNETAELLRHAVRYQEYEGLDSRILAYCDAVREQLDTLTGQHVRRRVVLMQTLDFLEWTRLMLCAGRAAYAGRLERAAFAGRYLGAPPSPATPAINLDL
jgi:hypothetical protein